MDSDIEFLKDVYATARNKYKPATVRTVLIAEAPPSTLDRFFYFEDVKTQDSLFLEIMGVLYPDQKKKYLAAGRDTALKIALLQTFQSDGFWLLNLSEIPFGITTDTPQSCVPSLLARLQKYIDKKTPVLLIKADLYDLCYPILREQGYRVSAERLPFPGSGQQRVFRAKFQKALDAF